MTTLRWGILGTGNIACQFADGVLSTPLSRARITAVGSRTLDAARAFASARDIPAAHGSYEALISDPTIDAIYNSLPNNLHHEWALRALAAGRHVLCEKPLALNHQQAKEMFDAARKHNRVLVEAFMYRSHPLTHAVIDSVRKGEIGELRLIRTSFCYRTTRTENIRFDRSLGGGALMDIGCYCINFSRLFAGAEPTRVHATAHLGPTGVDLITAGTLHFDNNIIASFTCGMDLHANNTATLNGTGGYLEIPFPWKPPATRAEYTLAYSTPPRMDNTGAAPPPRETRFVDANMELYALEARDFAATALGGKPSALSEQDSLANMKILDELRRQIGLHFPEP